MTIAKDHVVEIEYTLKDPKGQLLDSSVGQEPLAYLHGRGNIISGLEQELEGKKQGDKFEVVVDPENAYGKPRQELINTVSRSELAGVGDLQVGVRLQAQTPQGVQIFTVVSIQGDQVTLDGNHPLAGVTLHFEITVKSVREATEDEISHGHAHGPSGHKH